MRMSKTNLMIEILIFIVVCLLFSFLGWVAYLPSPGRSDVSLKFLHFTNDTAHVPQTVFAITNLGTGAAYCHRPAVIDMIYEGTNCPAWHVMLDGGASTTFRMPVPTELSLWKLRLTVDPEVGFIRTLKRYLPRAPAKRMPFTIYSDWVANPPAP